MKRRDFLTQVGRAAVVLGGSSLLGQDLFVRGADAAPVPLADLQGAIGPDEGTVITPSDRLYSKYQNGFNLRIQVLPAVVVLCSATSAITKSVQWARANGVSIRMRSGGHSYEGFSTGDGLVIDVSPMSSVTVDTTAQTAVIGAGAQLGAIYAKLGASGLVIPAGSGLSVGIAGLALGGGFGLLSRKLGLTADNVLSLKVVDVSGKLLNASASENPDLYWACRGGGNGNFGVATELELKVSPIGRVCVFMLGWSSTAAKEVIQAWQDWAPSVADEITCILKLTSVAPSGLCSVHCIGQFTAKTPGDDASASELSRLLKPLTSVGSPSVNISTKSFLDAASFFGGGEDPPVRFKAKSDYALEPLSSEGIDALLAGLQAIAVGAVAAIMDSYGGAVNRVASDATAFFHRAGTLFQMQYYSQWGSASQTASRLTMMRTLYDGLRPYFSGYSYVNYCDLDLAGWQKAYFGDNFTRLTQVKRAYDPTFVLSSGPQSIPPASI